MIFDEESMVTASAWNGFSGALIWSIELLNWPLFSKAASALFAFVHLPFL